MRMWGMAGALCLLAAAAQAQQFDGVWKGSVEKSTLEIKVTGGKLADSIKYPNGDDTFTGPVSVEGKVEAWLKTGNWRRQLIGTLSTLTVTDRGVCGGTAVFTRS